MKYMYLYSQFCLTINVSFIYWRLYFSLCVYLEFHYRFKCQLFMEDRSTFCLYPNVLLTPVIWILQIVFIPIWIVMCLSMTGVIYAIILAILLSRSPEIIREQHRGNLTTAVGYSLLVIPMLVFEVSLMVAWLSFWINL